MDKKLTEQIRWRAQAKCLDSDPQAYELNSFRGDRQYYAAGVCVGCKVTRECALDALEPLAIGTVRGGVWIGEHPHERASARRRLSVVALGHKP